jgi:hypothetical protein
MAIIQEKDRKIIKERFDESLKDEVKILFFKKSGVEFGLQIVMKIQSVNIVKKQRKFIQK